MLKRSLCLILIVVLLSVTLGVYAENVILEPVQERYSYTNSVYAGLQINGTTAICEGKGRGIYTYTTTHLLVMLQRKPTSGGSWASVASWTGTASGMGTALVSQTTSVSAGYTYRVRVRCQIKDSDGTVLETVYQYSHVWTV